MYARCAWWNLHIGDIRITFSWLHGKFLEWEVLIQCPERIGEINAQKKLNLDSLTLRRYYGVNDIITLKFSHTFMKFSQESKSNLPLWCELWNPGMQHHSLL